MNQLVKRAGLISLSTRLSARLTCASFAKRTLTSSGSDNDFRPSEELAKERYDSRANEDIERKRARLLYQSRKRGMLENGVIFSSFANKHLHKMNAVQLDQYDRLINLPTNDWDIFYWATKTKPTPPEYETQVMQMLREHVNSKVSIENLAKPDAVLGKTRPDDIVLPPVGKIYELDIDLDDVSLVDYKEQLFDPRIKRVGKGQMALMTNWRRKFFERRLRRKLPSLVSLGNLGTKFDGQVYTQKCDTRDALDVNIMSKHPIDTSFEKNMKHHETMQHILGRDITNDPLEYDDEVEAWADMFWHRNYGNHNHRIAPAAHIRCSKCSSNLHCSDPGLSGYIPQQLFIKLVQRGSDRKDDPTLLCQACNFDTTYQARIRHDLSPEAYERFLATIGVGAKAKTLLVVLCDLTDFPGSIWNNLINLVGGKCRLLVVGNKLDMLPYDGPGFIRRVLNSMRNNLSRLRPGEKDLYINDVIAISARTGFGVEGLVTRLLSYCEDPQDVYLIGNSNSGKSTLFSALMQTDLCAVRKGDLIARVARYKCKSAGVDMLRFPIDLCEAWQLETKRRKAERVERNTAERELALNRLSERRQESMPHMSMLVNRLSYETNSFTVTDRTTDSELVNPLSTSARFTPDHPLASIPESLPLSVDEGEKYSQNGFFHHTPSAHHPDQLHQLLTQEEYLEVFHNETFIPRKYSLRPLSSIFISGLARLDLLTSQSNIIVTIFASKYLPVHVVPTKNADKFYHSFLGTAYLGVPRGNEQRLAAWPDLANLGGEFHIQGSELRTAAADVVFSSIGWASINTVQDQECIVKAYTPEGRGIFLRTPPLVARANSWSSGKKQRNTPVFDHQHYDTVHLRMGSSL